MNSSSFFVVLLVVGAALGALLLFSNPSSAPATAVAASTSTGLQTISPQAESTAAAPWVDAGDDRVVGERETVRLDGSGGAAGGAVTYLWTSNGGLGFFADPTRPDTSYTAPSACDCQQTATLTLTVTNRSGVRSSDSLVLRVRDPIACPERACREPIEVIPPACPPQPHSTCPQPDVPCSGPCVSEAPSRPTCQQVPVPCRCAEGCSAAWDSAWPQVVPQLAAGDRPTPRIVRQFPAYVAEGSATPLRAVVTNPGCSSVCFAWSVSQGWLERADTLEPIYHAPLTERSEGEKVTITFTIHDSTGQPSYDQIRLRVNNVP